MRIASIMMGVIGGVIGVTCLLTVFFFPPDSSIFIGKLTTSIVLVLSSLILNWENVKNAATKTGSAFVVTTVTMTAGVFVFLGAVNYFAHTHKKEWDLTRDQVFTLSDQTTKVLQGVGDDVLVTAFFKRGEREAAAMEDLVNRYRLHSQKISLSLITPELRPDLVEKYKVTENSPRIIVESRGQESRLKEISEEALTNALIEVTQRAKKKLYFTQGHGEPALDSADETGIKASIDDLGSEGYVAAPLNLAETQSIPDDAAGLLIVGQTKPFFPPEAKLVEEYLDKGGKLMLLVEPQIATGLDGVLRKWRIELGNNTVIDVSSLGRQMGLGPDALLLFEYGEHPAVKEFEGVPTLFKGARSVSTVDGDASITATVLASSNQRSWGETKIAEGDWQWNDGEMRGPVPVMAAATKDTKDVEGKRSPSARLLVVGDTDVFNNQFRVMAGNRDLMLNSVAWLAEEENRIAIRPKQRGSSRPVLSPTQRTMIAFFALDGLPVALLSFGLGIWLVRRRR